MKYNAISLNIGHDSSAFDQAISQLVFSGTNYFAGAKVAIFTQLMSEGIRYLFEFNAIYVMASKVRALV